MNKLFTVSILLISGLSFNPKAIAQDILSRYGCGTGCIIQQHQLSQVILVSEDRRRVLVEKQGFVATETGSRPCLPSDRCDGQRKQLWIIADCANSPKINLGAYRSDGSDGYWFDVFDEQGFPLNSTASGWAHSHWEAICESQNTVKLKDKVE